MPIRLYSYVVTHDTGFSPNPFWGLCTLANCKPAIRRTAKVGDWVVGLSRRSDGNRMVFAMQVDEILDYARYYRDPRFLGKVPDYARGTVLHKAGDNIYQPMPGGGFRQLRSMHSRGEAEDPNTKKHDLGGRNVLIARKFYYFGSTGPELPRHLEELKVGRGHKNRFSPQVISGFLELIASYPQGVNGPPTNWPRGDHSWREGGT